MKKAYPDALLMCMNCVSTAYILMQNSENYGHFSIESYILCRALISDCFCWKYMTISFNIVFNLQFSVA